MAAPYRGGLPARRAALPPLCLDAAAAAGRKRLGYHRSTTFLDRLYARELALHPAERQGFAVAARPNLT